MSGFLIAERDSHVCPGDGRPTLVRQEGDDFYRLGQAGELERIAAVQR